MVLKAYLDQSATEKRIKLHCMHTIWEAEYDLSRSGDELLPVVLHWDREIESMGGLHRHRVGLPKMQPKRHSFWELWVACLQHGSSWCVRTSYLDVAAWTIMSYPCLHSRTWSSGKHSSCSKVHIAATGLASC